MNKRDVANQGGIMKKDLLLIPGITFVLMFIALGFFFGCTDGGGVDAQYDSLTVDKDTVTTGDTVTATIHMSGTETDKVSYEWSAVEGEMISGVDTQVAQWVAPDESGNYELKCTFSLGVPHSETKSIFVTVQN